MEKKYDEILQELEAEYEQKRKEILSLKEKAENSYKPMFMDKWIYDDSVSIWDDEQGVVYLEQGDLDSAIFSMKEYYKSKYGGTTPADAEFILRIAERFSELGKPRFEDFFKIDNIACYTDYTSCGYDQYTGVIKLAYLYIDYARYCFRTCKEELYRELESLVHGEIANDYVYLWHILESLLDVRSDEWEEYWAEAQRSVQKRPISFDFLHAPKEKIGHYANVLSDIADMDEIRHKSMAATLIMALIVEKEIKDVSFVFEMIKETHKLYEQCKATFRD